MSKQTQNLDAIQQSDLAEITSQLAAYAEWLERQQEIEAQLATTEATCKELASTIKQI